jgi:hypothetical protein
MSDRDWKAFTMILGDFDARSSPSMAESALRRGGIAVIADGEPGRLCPVWEEIRSSGRLENVANMDALADGASRIRENHPANIAEAFPRPLLLDRYIVAGAVLGASAAATLGAVDLHLGARLKAESEIHRGREAALEGRLSSLARNREEMTALQNEAPERSGYMRLGRHEALIGLAVDIPDALSLTALSIGKDNGFEIEGIVVGTGFDPESLRLSLERSGFRPSEQGGWVFDSASGRLSVRGRYGGPKT